MIIPVLKFNGNCSEAMDFYEKVFHATDIYKNFYREAPDDSGLPKTEEYKNRIMHAGMTICGTKFNMSDIDTQESIIAGNRNCFNVFMDSKEDVAHAFEFLKEKGTVVVDLGPQFFSPMYGAVKDQFGVHWQLMFDDNM